MLLEAQPSVGKLDAIRALARTAAVHLQHVVHPDPVDPVIADALHDQGRAPEPKPVIQEKPAVHVLSAEAEEKLQQ